ncbi:MAG: hypothetical protein SGBAC_004416 [Bacillariaceae sp.]
MTSSSIHLDDRSQQLPRTLHSAEQEVKDSDLASSPSRLGATKAAAVTPDTIERTSSRSRPRMDSVASDDSIGTGSSSLRLRELRSQRNAKLGALKKRIKSSHNALSTPVRNGETASGAKSQADIQIGDSDAQVADNDPTSRLDELRVKRKERLEEDASIGRRADSGSRLGSQALRQELHRPAGSPPPIITINGTGAAPDEEASPNRMVKSRNNIGTFSDDGILHAQSITASSDDTDMMSDSASVENDNGNDIFRRLSKDKLKEHSDGTSSMSHEMLRPSPARQGSVRSVDRGTPKRRYALRRRSSAPCSVEAIMTDEVTSSLSKLDRLRLRQAHNHEKAQLELAAFGTPRDRFGVEQQSSGESSAPNQMQQQMEVQMQNKQLAKQLHDVQEDGMKLQRQLEASRAALQLEREEKQSDAKIAAGAENDTFCLCKMIDELQCQVDSLREEKTEDNIRLEEALHKSRLEVAQLQEEVEEVQSKLKLSKAENKELNDKNELQKVRHANVTNMWEHRTKGLVCQLGALHHSLQDLSHARLQERSDLLRHVVLLQKENQRLRNGGKEEEKRYPRIRFWNPGSASLFGNRFPFMPLGSLLGQRHRTVKARAIRDTTWHPLRPAYKSEEISRRRVSTFWNRLVTWDTVKNVTLGAGFMGLALLSGGDPQITHDSGSPFIRLEIPTPLLKW